MLRGLPRLLGVSRLVAVAVAAVMVAVACEVGVAVGSASSLARRVVRCQAGSYAGLAANLVSVASPDLRYLAVARGPVDTVVSVLELATGRVRSVQVGGSQPNIRLVWSTDGRRLAFPLPGVQLGIMSVATGAVQRFTPGPPASAYGFLPVAWSPDGHTLLLSYPDPVLGADDYRQARLALYNLDDGSVRDLGVGRGGSFSPDGTRLAFYGPGSLPVIADVATGSVTQLVAPPGPQTQWGGGGWRGLFGSIGWSPDGQWIAYVEPTDAVYSGPTPLMLAAVDGSGARELGRIDNGAGVPPAGRFFSGARALTWTPKGIVTMGSPRGDHSYRPMWVDPAAGATRALLASRPGYTAWLLGTSPVSLRSLYALSGPSPTGKGGASVELGLRTVAVDGTGDRPLLPCTSPGNALVLGTAFNDVITTRNGKPDTVRCGAGTDTVTADTIDTVSGDCEQVRRAA